MKKLVSLLLAVVLMCSAAMVAAAELKGPGNVTLHRLGTNVGFDVNNDINGKNFQEKTGYDVVYYTQPAQNADEKIQMELAGKTAPYDIMKLNVNLWRTLMVNGMLQPLEDALAKYGKDILAGCSQEAWDAVTVDGHIYGIPMTYPYDTEITTFMACRMDLMRAAGIEKLPETIDEFYDVLVALKNFYGDEYIVFCGPYCPPTESSSSNWVIPKTIACAFGIYSDWMVDDNGKVIYMTEAEGFADMIAFLTKLRSEGLIDADWAVNTDSTVNEKFSSGKAIIACSNRAGVNVTTPAQMSVLGLDWDDLGYIGALKGNKYTTKYMETDALGNIPCIPVSSKNLEDAINYMNLQVQNQEYLSLGEEKVHWYYDENGKYTPINPIFSTERGNSYWYNDALNVYDWKVQWPTRIRKSAAQWAAFEAVTINADTSTIVKNEFKFMPSTEAYAENNSVLFKNLEDFILQVMSGTRTIDDLPTFQKEWANNEGEAVRTELQEYYNGHK